MARVERALSTAPIAVEQAQLINPAAFQFSTAGAQTLQQIGGVLEELGKRKVEMQDKIGVSNINAAMENAQREYEKEIIGKPVEEHAAILVKHRNNAVSVAGQQRITPDTRKLADSKLQIWGDTFADLGEIATIKSVERDAVIAVTTDYEKALTEGTPEDIVEAEIALDAQYKGSYGPGEAEELKLQAEQRAVDQMEKNAVNAVHDAIEAASVPGSTGDFTLAKELAKSPSIDGRTSTALRSAISTAEKALETRKDNAEKAKTDQLTSQTITDFWTLDENGNSAMTVAELMRRRATGFLKDTEFKSMMKSLTTTIPTNSDPIAMGKIRRARIDFNMGAINKADADKITLENYVQLDGPDRSTVLSDLEDVSGKIIATAESNADSEGRLLISPQFLGIKDEGDLIRSLTGITGLTEDDKSRINRRFTAEIQNRDLYERAVQDRYRQMRKDGITDTTMFTSESLKILLQYKKRTDLSLQELEAEVSGEQQRILINPAEVGPPAPKPIDKMTSTERLIELRSLTR